MRIADSFFSTAETVLISGLTLEGGDSALSGGAIESGAHLTIKDSRISNNSSKSDGGGIHQTYGSLTIERSTISDNRAGGDGGGVYELTKRPQYVDSTFSGNQAATGGGGIWTGLPILLPPPFGSASIEGVGDVGVPSTRVTLRNSTISGNRAGGNGGGLYVAVLNTLSNANVSVSHSTITRNFANSGGAGGGVFISRGSLSLENSIVATNGLGSSPFLTSGIGPDLTGFFGASVSRVFFNDWQ